MYSQFSGFFKPLSTFFLLTFFLTNSFAQKSYVKGIVKDAKSKELLPGVAISFDNTGAVTDIDGVFIISSEPDSKKKIKFELIGYDTKTVEFVFPKSDTLNTIIELKGMNEVLDEVVISAGKFEQKISDVTVSMDVIKPSLIENKNTTNMGIFMNQVPSVNTYDGQISIRNGSGFSYGAGSRVLVLVDEMPMLSADAGDIKWNYLPVENVEQVEVLKGAASALFGSSALNGVINFRTAYAKDKPITTLNVYNGIYDRPERDQLWYWKGRNNPRYDGLNFNHSQKLGQLDLVVGGHLFSDDGFRESEIETRKRGNINLRYRFKKINGLSVGVNLNTMNTSGGLFFLWKADTAAFRPADNTIQVYNNYRFNIDPYIVYFTEKAGKHSLRTRYFRTNNINDKNQGSLAELYYAEYQFQKKFKNNLIFTSGIVNMEQQIFSDSVYGRHTGKNRAVFVQFDKKFWSKLTLSLGIRGEYYKVDSAQTRGEIKLGSLQKNNLPFQPVMRIGTSYQVAKFTFARASFGQGYRFPSVAEKFINTAVSALKIFPNPNLQPERGWSAELGIKQGFRIADFRGFFDVAGYLTEYRNMIEFVFGYYFPQDLTSPTFTDYINYAGFQSKNIERGKITGIDISVTGKGKIGPVDITIFGGYTFSDAINPNYIAKDDTISPGSDSLSNRLKYRTRHLFKNDIQLDWKKFSLGWSVRYTSRMDNIDKRFEESLFYDQIPGLKAYILPGLKEYRQNEKNGYWINDLRCSYSFSEHLKASFIVNNVFNTEYAMRPGLLGSPRTFIFQFGLKL
ncbi:MAG: TonB-dependent receptor [Bacteroidota bacterium]|jgi:outer membrane cobalamin receptor